MKKLTILFAFLTFLGFQIVQGQAQEISGTITSSETGEGLPGVTVVIRGTTIGTITDIDGTYTINVPEDAEQTLMFTFIGMKTQEIPIGGKTIIDVVLESDVFGLDEVIVTAIGIKRERREITYQTQKVVGEDIVAVAPTRIASALAGKIAGLQINVQDNGVNPNTQILLRGLRSITASNSALIVIDGSISSPAAFDDLNPNDIGEISVLKGATAAALYGSAAGNGALIVTTKTGKGADKFTVGINSSYTMEKVAYMPDLQTEYGTGWGGLYDNIENTNWGPRFDGQLRQIGPTMPEGYVLETQMVPYAPVKNNLLGFYETGNTMTNTVYVTGSTEDSRYYVSFGDQRADGIVMNDIVDIKVDKLSNELFARPLVSGSISRKKAAIFAVVCMISSFILSIFFYEELLSYIVLFSILIFAYFLATIYNYASKKYPGMDIFVAGAVFFLILFGAATETNSIGQLLSNPLVWIVAFIGALQVLFMNMINGAIKDIDHDEKGLADTLAIRLGAKTRKGVITLPTSFKTVGYSVELARSFLIFLPFLFLTQFNKIGEISILLRIAILFIFTVITLFSIYKLFSIKTFDRNHIRKWIATIVIVMYATTPIMLSSLNLYIILVAFVPPLWFILSNLVLHGTVLTPKTM